MSSPARGRTLDELLRVYLDPAEVDAQTGYPHAWHRAVRTPESFKVLHDNVVQTTGGAIIRPRIPDYVRELAGHRCIRCGHPFVVGETPGEWSPCDERCTHGGPIRVWSEFGRNVDPSPTILGPHDIPAEIDGGFDVEAQWRVLTVHHLNGIKHDCRWFNLVALCQRCHLTIQGKVYMDRPYNRPHSEWFKLYAAAFYALKYLDAELSVEETWERLDELLELELTQERLW